jgi:hypothetical protein
MDGDRDFLTVTEVKKIIVKHQKGLVWRDFFIGLLMMLPLILTTILLVIGIFENNMSYPKSLGSETVAKWIMFVVLMLVVAVVAFLFLYWLIKGKKVRAKIKKYNHDCPAITNYSPKTLVNTGDGIVRISKYTCIVIKNGYFEYSDGLIWDKKTIEDNLSLVDDKELYVEACGTLMIYSNEYSIERVKSESGLGVSAAIRIIKL